jgi:hypothetical protein
MLISAAGGLVAGGSPAPAAVTQPRQLLVLSERTAAGQPTATLRLLAATRLLVARLNGRRVDRLFGSGAKVTTAALASDDGLRFGVNTLRVTVFAFGGRSQTQTVRFTILRRAPLASGGPDLVTRTGVAVRLDAGHSVRAHSGGLLYHWTVVGAPHGSGALRLVQRGRRIRFAADRPGVYRVRLVATEYDAGARAAASAADTVTIIARSSQIPPIGEPVKLSDGLITIGSSSYGSSGAGSAELVVLNRATLAFVVSQSYPVTQLGGQNLRDALSGYGNSDLFIVSAGNASSVNSSYNAVFAQFGAPAYAAGLNGFNIVGTIAGSSGDPPKATVQPAYGNTSLTGFLRVDSAGNYTFVGDQLRQFDTSAPGGTASQNTITIGNPSLGLNQTYTSAPLLGCANGGFQVLILDAYTLHRDLAATTDATYSTNQCNAGQDYDNLAAVANALNTAASSRQPLLVLMQAIGAPISGYGDVNVDYYSNQIGLALARLGGTPTAFNRNQSLLTRAGYSFVGTNGGPPMRAEVSGDEPGAHGPTRLTGFLQYDSRGEFAPTISAAGGVYAGTDTGQHPNPAVGLPLILSQAPQAWPGAGNPEYEKTLEYIASNVLHLVSDNNSCSGTVADVRSQYCDTAQYKNGQTWADNFDTLSQSSYPGAQAGFSHATWTSVKDELLKEFPMVDRVNGDLFAQEELYTTVGTRAATINLQSIADTIKNQLALSEPHSAGGGFWLDMLGSILTGLEYIPGIGTTAEFIVGETATGLELGAQFADNADGSSLAGPVLSSLTVDELAQQLESRYATIAQQYDAIQHVIVSDYGRLSAAQGANLGDVATGTVQTLQLAANQFTYSHLLASAFGVDQLINDGHLNPSSLTDASQYQCETNYYSNPAEYTPFGSNRLATDTPPPPPSALLPFSTDTGGVVSGTSYVMAGPGRPDEQHLYEAPVYPATPSAALMNPLVAPVQTDANGNPDSAPINAQGNPNPQGLYKPFLFTWDFDLSGATQIDCQLP